MEYRQLGQTSVEVSRIGFGCGPASGHDYGPVDPAEWIAAVRTALDEGINLFDVADVYGFGRAEELLAQALGGRRHDVIMATKCGLAWDETGRVHRDLSRKKVREALEGSLRRLQVERISLYQIHWPDPSTPIEDVMETLAECQSEGKIRWIGVSNFSLDLLRRARAVCRFESEQVGFNLLSRSAEFEVLPWCQTAQIAVLAHSALARGILAGKRSIGSKFDGTDTRKTSPYFSEDGLAEKTQLLQVIRELSTRTDRTFSSIALRWALDDPHMTAVLVGIKNRQQLSENLEAVGWQLNPKDRELLSQVSAACPEGLAGAPAHATKG